VSVNWAQVLFNSVVTGSLYLLGAVGLTLTYGLSQFPNFAHAEYLTLGAFVGYFIAGPLGLGLPAGLMVAFVFTGIVGALCYRGIFQPLGKRGASIIHLMVASIALSFILRYSTGAIWTWKPVYFASWPSFQVGPVRIVGLWLWLLATAVVLALTLHFTMVGTKIGKAIRATSSNPGLALSSGINIDRIVMLTWFIGAGLAAVAGIFRAADTQVYPMTGWDIILQLFAVAVLGGIGNYYGAITAAFAMGLAENLGVVVLLALGLSTEYRSAIAFLVIIITLIVKPRGLAMLFRRA
jgi:branched-subunit amino acid ABC-type transport system permease component